jgi:hypothetical protein
MQYRAESLSRSSSSLISLFWMNVKSRMEAQSRHSSDGERPAGHKRVSQNVLKNQQWFPCCPSPVTPAIGVPHQNRLVESEHANNSQHVLSEAIATFFQSRVR